MCHDMPMGLGNFLVEQGKRHRTLADFLTRVVREISPQTVIVLEYPLDSKPRWTLEQPNQPLYDIINRNRATYESHLKSFLGFTDDLLRIHERPPRDAPSVEPFWLNGWMPALDGVALYSLIAMNAPKCYLEVGSGNSTKFARRAISDRNLATRIVSIDPSPRAEINGLCDRTIRQPLESVDLEVFDALEANDILYIDNSHRVFMNSDATTVFLDVIPRLKPGVLVEIHDVTLPYDYPAEWISRYYSEQYLLAAYLLAKGNGLDVVMPSTFVSDDPDLKGVLSPLWARPEMQNVQTHGSSFWLRTK
jgi:hypothetical protein